MTPSTATATPEAKFTRNDLGMLMTVAIWGANITVAKQVFLAMTPGAFIALRFGLASVLLALLVVGRGGTLRASRATWLHALWVGIIGNSVYQLLFMNGLNRTTGANTALLIATAPVFTALYEVFRGREKPSRAGWAGIALSFLGMVLVLSARGAALGGTTLVGDLMILGAAVCWAIYTVGARPLLAEHSALKVTAMTMLTGTPLLLLLGAPALATTQWAALPPGAWGGVAYSTLLAIVVCYWIWYGSVRRVGAIRTGIYGNLVPVFGVLTAALVLSEPLYPLQGVGAAAILGGLWLSRR